MKGQIAHRHMNMDNGTEAAQCPEKEYINRIFLAVWDNPVPQTIVNIPLGKQARGIS